MTRGLEGDISQATSTVNDNLRLLANSKSIMLAMAHVVSLKQKADYDNDVAPNHVADWDRKTW